MPVVSSRYWNMVHGAVPEQVEEDLEGLYTIRVLGRNMAYLLKCQEAAKRAGVSLPERETAIFTNFGSGDWRCPPTSNAECVPLGIACQFC